MPISEIGRKTISNSSAPQRGVTLVELLVVLAIIAMVASVVVLSAPPPRSATQKAGEALAARVNFAADEAVTAGVTIGLELSEAGYRFLKYDRDGWTEADSQHLHSYRYPADVAIEFDVEEAAKKNEQDTSRKKDEEKRPEPDIRFTPTGETTPFIATFKDQRGTAIVALNASGGVTITTNDAR